MYFVVLKFMYFFFAFRNVAQNRTDEVTKLSVELNAFNFLSLFFFKCIYTVATFFEERNICK